MIDKPSLLDTPNLINSNEYTVSPIPGASVDDCYAHQSIIRGDYDGTDVNEWNVGKLVQETLPAAEWDAFCHDLTGFGWQITQVVKSIWEEIYCLIHGAQSGMAQEAITQLLSGAQTFTNKTISFYSNTLTGVVSVDTAQTLTNKTISFDSNTLQNVASLNTTQTLTGKTLNLDLDTNKIYVSTADRVLVSDANKKIVPTANTTVTEIEYVHGVTSAIQTQIDSKQPNITGAATSITGSNLTANKALISDGSGKVAVSSTTSTELGYVSGVTSAIQTQIDSKQPNITGAATSITGSNLTVNKALISDGSGKVAVSATTSTELGYVSGVTSAIQTQLDGKQPNLTGAATTIASSDLTVNRALISDGSGKVAVSATTSTELGYVAGVTSAIQTQIDGKQPTLTAGAGITITGNTISVSGVFDLVYPVGSIYLSVNSANPGTLFGGTWVSIGAGRTIVGVNTGDTDYNTVEKTGGAKTVTLAVTNLPAHNHTASSSSSSSSSSTFTGSSVNTGGMSTNPTHNHSISGYKGVINSGSNNIAFAGSGSTAGSTNTGGKAITNHTHSVTAAGTVKTTTTTTTTTTIGNTGSGTAFDIKNPYLTVYMWKRTA